jgi:CcmD family protein
MRSRTSRLALALTAALLLASPFPPAARAQGTSAPATAATAPASTGAAPTADARASTATASNGLPAEAAPPRTLRAYWHVWIAFTLAWVLLFGYLVSVGRRFGKLEREVEALGG